MMLAKAHAPIKVPDTTAPALKSLNRSGGSCDRISARQLSIRLNDIRALVAASVKPTAVSWFKNLLWATQSRFGLGVFMRSRG